MEDNKKIVVLVCLVIVLAIASFILIASSNRVSAQEFTINIISGTEYDVGNMGQLVVEIRDKNFNPINATCFFTIFYPNKNYFVSSGNASGITDVGTYFYTFQVPSVEGVYEYSVSCTKGAKTYVVGKSFHVRNYLAEFELEAQDTVKLGEMATTGWRTQSGGRKITSLNCSIPGTGSLFNNNESFKWDWYVNGSIFKPGTEYNLTCGVGYSTPTYEEWQMHLITMQLATIFNDTFDRPDVSWYCYNGTWPGNCIWDNGWYVAWGLGGGAIISNQSLEISSSSYLDTLVVKRILNHSVTNMREIRFSLNATQITNGSNNFEIIFSSSIDEGPYGALVFWTNGSWNSSIYAINGPGNSYSYYGPGENLTKIGDFYPNISINISIRNIDMTTLTYDVYLNFIYVGTFDMMPWGYGLPYSSWTYTWQNVTVPILDVYFSATGGPITYRINDFYLYSNLSDIYPYNVTQVYVLWDKNWSIITASYVRKISVAAKESDISDVFFKADGTKMYTLGLGGDTVDEYNLGTPWDVSSATYVEEFSVVAREATSRGVFFKPDGLKMYVVGSSSDNVDEYDLGTAWNVTTAVFLQNLSVNAHDTFSAGVFFKSDGLRMYVAGESGDSVDEYALGTAWNVTTAVYQREASVAAHETGITGVFFRDDGLKMYTIGTTGDSVDEYNLSNAWNVSSAIYSQEFYVGDKDPTPTGLFFKPGGSGLYVAGASGDAVYEFEVGKELSSTSVNYTWRDGNFSTCPALEDPVVYNATYGIPENTSRFTWFAFGVNWTVPDRCVHVNGSSSGTLQLMAERYSYVGDWFKNIYCFNGITFEAFFRSESGYQGLGMCEQVGYIYYNTTKNSYPPEVMVSNVTLTTRELVQYGMVTNNVSLIDYFRVEKGLKAWIEH
jgi:hypothetical protein